MEYLALAVDHLIAANYDEALLWKKTPRQLSAQLNLAMRRQRHDRAQALWITAVGSQGESKEIQKQFKKLLKDDKP